MKLFPTLLLPLILVSTIALAEPPSERVDYFVPPSYDGFVWQEEAAIGIYLYRIQDGDTVRDIMMFRGPFNQNTTDIIQFFLDQYPEITELSMNSPGGMAFEAFKLGQYLSDKGLSVTVSPGAGCYSACAYAFLGGTNYRIDGVLGFHTAFIMPPEPIQTPTGPTQPVFSLDDMNGIYREGQTTGGVFLHWFLTNGFTADLVMRIMIETAPDRFLVFMHEDELLKFYVRNDDAEADTDGIIKYMQPVDGVPDPVVMTDVEAGEWMAANTTHNNRGRPVIAWKQLWPLEAPDQN
jgi:hypothetical protein